MADLRGNLNITGNLAVDGTFTASGCEYLTATPTGGLTLSGGLFCSTVTTPGMVRCGGITVFPNPQPVGSGSGSEVAVAEIDDDGKITCSSLESSGDIVCADITAFSLTVNGVDFATHGHALADITGTGTAAALNAGTGEGDVPVLGDGGLLLPCVIVRTTSMRDIGGSIQQDDITINGCHGSIDGTPEDGTPDEWVVFMLPKFGTWKLNLSAHGQRFTGEVIVDEVKKYVLCAETEVIVNNLNEDELRNAIASACDGNTITFAQTGTLNLTSALNINRPMTINGSGITLVRADGADCAAFNINGAGSVALSGLNISGFNRSGILYPGTATGNLSLNGVTITGCSNDGQKGGAIFATESGTIHMADCRITKNRAHKGAGIYVEGPLKMDRTLIAGNDAANVAGGIYLAGDGDSPRFAVANSIITGNRAYAAAGILQQGGVLSLDNNSVIGNISNPESGFEAAGFYCLGGKYWTGTLGQFEQFLLRGNIFDGNKGCGEGYQRNVNDIINGYDYYCIWNYTGNFGGGTHLLNQVCPCNDYVSFTDAYFHAAEHAELYAAWTNALYESWDLHLAPGAAAINAGLNTALDSGGSSTDLDYDKNPRLVGDACDCGALEYQTTEEA